MSLSPAVSELSLRASVSTLSNLSLEESTKNLFKDFKNMSKDELVSAIAKCRVLIADTEEMSSSRVWLTRKLIDLRYRLANINALREDYKISDTSVGGHCFVELRQAPSKRMYCDFCTNIIWIFQGCYTCTDCFFSVHSKCLKHVSRVCAHISVSEKGRPEYRICPEIGLSMQVILILKPC